MICALDPRKIIRSLEDISLLTYAQIIINASLAHQSSSAFSDFHPTGCPQIDPPECNKFLTLKQENGQVLVGELPLGHWGGLKENYEVRHMD
jgi:hypothetical protein